MVELVIIDILILLWMHTIADFMLQSRNIAENKSSDNNILAAHVFIYHLPFYWFGWQFAIINMIAHFITDHITSRATKIAWRNNEIWWFFVIIGLDQAIHITTLILTYWWLFL